MASLRAIARGPAAASALLLAACGSGGGGGGGPAPTDIAGAPTCAPGTLQLVGSFGGVDYTGTYPLGGYGFINVGNPSSLTASFGDGGSLKLQWMGTIADGQVASASGSVVLPSEGGPGTSACAGVGTQIEPIMGGGKFALKTMVASDKCPVSTTAGADVLVGCYGFKQR